MIYHLTVNGKPACSSKEAQDNRINGKIATCHHIAKDSIEIAIEHIREFYPDATYEIVEGDCPIYTASREAMLAQEEELTEEDTRIAGAQKYEYLIKTIEGNLTKHLNPLTLNELGSEGWKLVSVVRWNIGPPVMVAYFIRELTSTEKDEC